MSGDEPFDESPVTSGEVVRTNLFGNQRTAAAINNGAQQATDEANERRAYILETIAISAELIKSWNDAYPDNMARGALYKAASMKLAHQVLTGEIAVTGGQVASLVRELSQAGRLEMGEVTSSHESVTTPAERKERLKEIQEAVSAAREDAERAEEAAKVVPMGGGA